MLPAGFQAYRADIDGLRAIAVLPVVGFHAFPNVITGGFIGVDIFFVISGFLISNIVFSGLDRGSFSFAEFYGRRVRRIFPALILVLAACYAFGWFSLLADEYKQLGKHIAAGAAFISNLILRGEAGYFDNVAETKPLLHLWSLGIEEQFYIAWPLMAWLAWKMRFNLAALIGLICIASFALNVATIRDDTVGAFYSPTTRIWELLAGALLAYLSLYSGRPKGSGAVFGLSETRTADAKSIIGITLIAFALALLDKYRAFPGWWALLPTAGTYLIISAGPSAWFNRTVLSVPALMWVGLISFPLYLWHWPLLSFARVIGSETPSIGIRIAAVLLSFVLAALTYLLIERPIRFGSHRQLKTLCLCATMVVAAGIGFATYRKSGLPDRAVLRPYLEQARAFEWDNDRKFDDACTKKYAYANLGVCLETDVSRPATVVLIGDSHANHLFWGLSERYRKSGDNLLQVTYGGCVPFYDVQSQGIGAKDFCVGLMQNALDFVLGLSAVHTVILASRGPLYLTGKGFNEPEFDRYFKLATRPEVTDNRAVFAIGMRSTLERILGANKKVVFILDHPELGFDPKSCRNIRPVSLAPIPNPACTIERAVVDARNVGYRSTVSEVLRDFPAVRLFDASKHLCDDWLCYAKRDGVMLYSDDDHLSVEGSLFIGERIFSELESAPRVSAGGQSPRP